MIIQNFSLASNLIQLAIIYVIIFVTIKLGCNIVNKRKIYLKILVSAFMYSFARNNIIFTLNGLYKLLYSQNLQTQSLLQTNNILQVKNNFLGTIISSNGLLELVTLTIYAIFLIFILVFIKDNNDANAAK